MLIALDSNVVDLVEEACFSSDHIDAMEAMEPPPRFRDMSPGLEVEVFARCWLLAMARPEQRHAERHQHAPERVTAWR